MTPTPDLEKPKTPLARTLSKTAQAALLLSVMGVLLSVAGCVGGRAGTQVGLVLNLAGIASSIGTVTAGILAGRARVGETLVDRSPSLLLPYLLIQPVCYFEVLGEGLGGNIEGSNRYGYLGSTALILGAVTFVAILWSYLRSRPSP